MVIAVLLFTSISVPAITLAEEGQGRSIQPSSTSSLSSDAALATLATNVSNNGSSAGEDGVESAAATGNGEARSGQSDIGVGTADPVATISPAQSQPAPAAVITVNPADPIAASGKDGKTTASDGTTSGTTDARSTQVQNNTTSSASSGNAAVIDNYKAGDATSGKATANATVINVIGTGSGLGTESITFVKDIYNDVGSDEIQGNITIDPNTLTALATLDTTRQNKAQNSVALLAIENTIVLDAVSGDATVSDNYKAGNATSGDAVALANLINIVHSSIGAERSFLGVVNIHGNLRGDILVPASFVDSLFDSNVVDPRTTGTSSTTDSLAQSSVNDTIAITNNVSLHALSGNATVSDNYKAGDATSGDALTNLTVYNLTGRQVVAKNSLLVFVNVMGTWVGMIVDAPAGSTAAALGGGIGNATNISTGQIDVAGDHQSITSITNNISVSATSGDATVSDNYKAGNATSGNATAGANILNFVHSSFTLDDWFGALFINVLGSWVGNFSINRPATSTDGTAPPNATTIPSAPVRPISSSAIQAVKVFQFNGDTAFVAQPVAASSTSSPAAAAPTEESTVLAASQVVGQANGAAAVSAPQTLEHNDRSGVSTALLTGLGLLIALAVFVAHRQRLRVGEGRHSIISK